MIQNLVKFNIFHVSTWRNLAIIGLTLLYLFQAKAQEQEVNTSDYQVLTENGAWCWFADPRAVYYKKGKEQIYYGYINTEGDVVISSKNLKTKKIIDFILHDKLQVDDHNVPSILFLPDGKILTFYTEHNGKFFMRKSVNPEDISAWEPEQELSFGLKDDLITYSHPVMLSAENNRIYMFFRSRNKRIKDKPNYTDWHQNYVYSDDYGKTWSNAQYFLSSKGDYDRIPYMKVVSDNKSKIHFLFTNGHPKLDKASVFHMYYEKGNFHQTDGKTIGPFANSSLNISNINKIYDAEQGQLRAWIWDIALDKNGYPVVTYGKYPTVNDHIFYYARWNGKKWLEKEIVNTGGYITSPEPNGKVLEEHYSGGVVLDHNNPDNIFLSRKINDVFEIEHWIVKDNTWQITPLTRNSKTNNVRPYVVDYYNGKKPFVMWMNGKYEHYTRYNTKLLLNRN